MYEEVKQKEPLIGQRILVGLTYLSEEGLIQERIELYGEICSTEDSILIFNRADGEGEFSIPLEDDIKRADPNAKYTLALTGEEITGIDFVSTWTIYHPDANED
tara:strand:+ start:150 stop:461 length:312 start_codon:yes stop_codon:yes gene_type:complete